MNDANEKSKERKPVKRKKAAILAILLGSFGIHKFYLRRYVQGIWYLLFFWTFVPLALGIIEGIKYLVMGDDKFDAKYNNPDYVRPKKQKILMIVAMSAFAMFFGSAAIFGLIQSRDQMKAEQFINDGKYEEAKVLLDKYDNNTITTHTLYAKLYAAEGKYDEATTELLECCKTDIRFTPESDTAELMDSYAEKASDGVKSQVKAFYDEYHRAQEEKARAEEEKKAAKEKKKATKEAISEPDAAEEKTEPENNVVTPEPAPAVAEEPKPEPKAEKPAEIKKEEEVKVETTDEDTSSAIKEDEEALKAEAENVQKLMDLMEKTVDIAKETTKALGYTAKYDFYGSDVSEDIEEYDAETLKEFWVVDVKDIDAANKTVTICTDDKDPNYVPENTVSWETACITAEKYGKNEYPYGFSLHYIFGLISGTQLKDGSQEIKAECTIKNQYGVKLDTICEARVGGSDENPIVTYFFVYDD